MKFICFLIVSVSASYLISCTKGGKDETVYNQCLITKLYTGSDTGANDATFFYYNANDIIATIDMPGPGPNSVGTFTFNGNVITEASGQAGFYGRYYLRPDSLASSSTRYTLGTLADTTLYFYDANGYRIKEVNYSTYFGKDSTILTYSNGNLASFKRYHSNGDSTYASFEYTSDAAKSWFYNNIGINSNFGYYYPWLGKPNKNLIKNYSSNFNIGPHTLNFTYRFNASGYVTDFQTTGVGSPYRTYFEYQCE